MDLNRPLSRENLLYLESIYRDFQSDPESIDPHWRSYFETFESTGDKLASNAAPAPGKTPKAKSAAANETKSAPSGNGRSADQILEYFRSSQVFTKMADGDLAILVNMASELKLPAGHVIFRMGEIGNDLYFIKEGRVAIERAGKEITRLGPGEVIGELAVFDHRPRSADIVTKTPVELLRIHSADLHAAIKNNPNLALGLLHIMASRLREAGLRQERVDQLVGAFRERGHVMARLDPLERPISEHPELSLAFYGFQEKDLDIKFSVKLGHETETRSLGEILEQLKAVYCQAIGAQFMHIDDLDIQEWIRIRLEEYGGRFDISHPEQALILRRLTDAEVFEAFLQRNYQGAKRFSLEGAESLIPLLEYAIEEAGKQKLDEIVIGMAHRGRLNVLVNIMGKPASSVFHEFDDKQPERQLGRGDVKYHLGFSCDRVTQSGYKVHLSLAFNPSHLEFVGPVVLGRVRAKQDRFKDLERSRALPLIIHGDAAFTGQGVVQEIFNLSELPGYSTGGAVHIVVNNQIGFTTDPKDGRSSEYSTDVARMLQIPIFHVNGENPEAVAEVIKIAMDFRQKFKKDVVIDMYCYRKYGHNESDEPEFTQPLMYKAIAKRKSVRAAYVENLLGLGGITQADADRIAKESKERLENELSQARNPGFEPKRGKAGKNLWSKYQGGPDAEVPAVPTKVAYEDLKRFLIKLSETPAGFTPHRKIVNLLDQFRAVAEQDQPFQWGIGEALAFATLLAEGVPVRFSGQDAERGTFSHRHAVLHDFETGETYTPLRHIAENQGEFQIYNSPLSEIAVLGFEYGVSLDRPDALLIWEAQFGDFCNVAQVIIDQFITSSEDKWRRLSGLCLFLPHGFEGQGPEHSSARLERFLMLSAEDNLQVVNLTTPAQLFHCLRRQVHRPIRKPLIVMSPKSLLRMKEASSTLQDLAEGQFQKIIPDQSNLDPSKVGRILLCSGKVYYDLAKERAARGLEDTAILRMEQYYPLPAQELAEELAVFPEATPIVWVQEEPLNMGAWSFLKLKLGERIAGSGTHPLICISRSESASPATGSNSSHHWEQRDLVDRALTFGAPADSGKNPK